MFIWMKNKKTGFTWEGTDEHFIDQFNGSALKLFEMSEKEMEMISEECLKQGPLTQSFYYDVIKSIWNEKIESDYVMLQIYDSCGNASYLT